MNNYRKIPVYKELNLLLKNFQGNFGLWFNKFISLSYDKKKEAYVVGNNDIEFYKDKYKQLSSSAKKILIKKHISQYLFCDSFKDKFETIVVQAQLKSNLITGIGQSHPTEIGMTFDHTIGLPYIPASTIKGVVRLAHILNYIEENQELLENKEKIDLSETNIPDIFGGDQKENEKINTYRGSVIFLDAYPEEVPKLYVDIMNPHYGDYYQKGGPPGDYLPPVPIKFLTVAKGTKFIFRALISKDKEKLKDGVISALKKALTEEGIGAKTALGYGLFKIEKWEESENIINIVQKFKELEEKRKIELEKEKLKKEEEEKISKMSEVEKKCYILLKNKDENFSYELYNELDKYDDKDKLIIAQALKEFWQSIGKWGKGVSKKQKEKNKKIEKILLKN